MLTDTDSVVIFGYKQYQTNGNFLKTVTKKKEKLFKTDQKSTLEVEEMKEFVQLELNENRKWKRIKLIYEK